MASKGTVVNVPNGERRAYSLESKNRLRGEPNLDHRPDSYDDVDMEYNPLLLSSLERYLPPSLQTSSRDSKLHFMKDVLSRYFPSDVELTRVQKHREYRQRIMSSYQPLHKELYTMSPSNFFLPSFLRAVNENSGQSLRSIIAEPVCGVYFFDMLQPSFCEMMMSEVENFERWVHDTRFKIMRPNTMNKYGAVLDDFGLENMLEKFMNEYVSPLSKVLFPEVGGFTLDSHHGFVVEYGSNRDVELAFHVDDSEVTLNVCLGSQFSGGELFFRGVRCEKHLNSETQPEEVLDYCHIPGRAVLHRGRHRHGARATTSGRRINLLLWCRSSMFRELKKYQKDCHGWCGECQRDKQERQRVSVDATKLELLKRDGISAS